MKIKRTVGYHVVVITHSQTGEQTILAAPETEEIEVKGLKQAPLALLNGMAKLFGVSL